MKEEFVHLIRLLIVCVAVLAVAAPLVQAGEPVLGLDVGAALPVSTFRQTADPGGSIAPFIGYRLGNRFAVMPLFQIQYSVFNTDVAVNPEDDITALFATTVGARFSLNDDREEIFLTVQGGWYTDFDGPVNDNGEGFSIAGGFNYDLWKNTALGLFIRRDQTSMDAARGSHDDLMYLTTGLNLVHRFMPPPPPPPSAALVAKAQAVVPPTVKKAKIVLRGVTFDFDKSVLRDDARSTLDEVVKVLDAHGDISVTVKGHTDNVGVDAYNQKLSERRAQAVRDYLVEHGVDAARLKAKGFGASQPVASNETRDGRAQNRRAVLGFAEEE